MEKILRGALAALGCEDKEIRLFLACYTRGASTLGDLAQSARLQRSTAYLIIKSLLEKGLVTEDHKAYGKSFTAIEPAALQRLVASRQRQIGRQSLAIEEHMDELQALHHTSEIRPRVRTYQGIHGLVSVWRDILTAKGEILLWTNQETESKLFSPDYHQQFIAERYRGGIPARVLAVDNLAGRELLLSDGGALRTTRILPAAISFSAETYVYDHKVAVLDYNQDIIGVITESQQIAAAQRAIFETAWLSLD